VTLPGGIGVSHLRVYDGGGTPHIHTVCSEAYVVVGGRGAVQTLTIAEGFRETSLEPGAVVSFPPGTIHRLVNDDALEIYVLMSNAGLPEAGDMVITFEPGVVADPAKYVAAATLLEPSLVSAAARRDRGVEGFLRLRAGGEDALHAFHGLAARLVEPKIAEWRARAEPDRTPDMLDALASGDVGHFGEARVTRHDAVDRFGCCGTLGAYVV
jgi:mannose-6-phosphate isomerase-like protein (cupin superfamily)